MIAGLLRLWRRWTEPSTQITEVGARRSARLLASLTLALIPLGLASTVIQRLTVPRFTTAFFVILAALLVLGVLYRLCRTVHYRIAGVIASLVPILAGGMVGVTIPGDPAWFAFMSLGQVLASAFLPAAQVGIIGAITVAVTAGVLLNSGDLAGAGAGAAVLSFSVIFALLVTQVTRHRSRLEAERQSEIRESQTLYRILFENAPVGIGVVTLDGRMVTFNDALPRQGGYSREDLQGLTNVAEHCYDSASRATVLAMLRQDGRISACEVRMRAKNGAPYEISLSLVPISFEEQRCTLAISQDISERKRAEAERRDLSEILENSLNEIFLFDPTTLRIEYANEGARRNLGYSMEELRLLTPVDLKPRFNQESFRDLIGPLLRSETESLLFETVHRRADSSCYPIEVHLQLARHSGHPVVAAVILDVTTREQAEQEQRRLSSELLSKKRRFQSLVMHSSDLIALVGADARVKYLNPAFETILGYPTEDWIGSSVLELVSQEDRPAAEALLSRGLEAPGKVIPGLLRVQRADGSLCWMEGTATNYPDDSDTPGIVINARDVTERLLGEETTRQNEMRLRVAIDTAEVAVFEMDTDLRYTWIFHPQLGYSPEQVVGRTDQDLLGEDGLHLMGIKSRVLATGQRTREEVRVRHGGTESTFDLTVEPRRSESGAIVGLRGASLDISEAKALRAQFLHAQKLDTVGRLAGGIAHDFNNLLTVIDGAAQLAAMRVEAGDPMQADISEIRLASKRAASLTKQLLAFSRKQVLQPAVVNLNAVVTDVSTMLRRLIGVDIELRVRAAHDLGNVEVDRGQIEQVILNLVINARDAMSEGGLLAIETQDVDVKESAAKALSVPPGLYVMMTVSDTGVGMDEITRDRLFEPFFTTKPAGQGTGLGLSTVYGILRQSGGGILVSSELGGGCTIEVYLPRVSGKPLAEQPPADRTVARGTETILLVEDDHAVRGLACRFLELAGYRVLLAANGTEAIRLLEVQTDPVDLMITDIVMPGMGGMELAKRLAMIRPQLPVLFASGFSDHVLTSLGPDAHFIEKPYSMAELTQKVRSALDVTSGGPSAGRTLRSGARTPRVA